MTRSSSLHLDPGTTDLPLDDADNLDPPSAPLPTHPQSRKIWEKSSPAFCKSHSNRNFAHSSFRYSLSFLTLRSMGQFFSPLFRYIVLASFGVDGKWAVSGDITQDVAVLLFTGRLTLYSEMHAGLIDIEEYESYHS